MTTTLTRIQLLSKSGTSLAGSDPILLDGELAIADSGGTLPTVKIGDGVRHWSTLPALMSDAPDYVAGPTVTLPPGSPATVVIDNVAVPPSISFGIPAGADGAASAAGADTDIQFRDGGSFGGDARWTFAKTTGTVTLNGGKMTIVAGSSSAALQITGAAGFPAIIATAGAGGHAVEHVGGPSTFVNDGLPLLLLDHSSAGFSTLQNDSPGNWSLGYTSGTGSALGTPIVKWNSTGNVAIPAPSSGSNLALTAHAGAPALIVDVAAGANAIQITNGTPTFDISIDGAGNGYLSMFGAGTTMSLGASGANDVHIAADHGLYMTGATGGSKGAGTINAVGFYVNGVAFSTPTGANPTASVGLAAVNGSAATFLRSDGAPALSQAIAPTWTGAHVFAAPSGVPVSVTAIASGRGIVIDSSAGAFNALQINAGGVFTAGLNMTPSGVAYFMAFGAASILQLGANSGNDLTIAADHGIYTVGATGTSKGSGTINAHTGVYVDGVALANQAGANPTATIGLAAVNGSAVTFMRSDAAPALSQAIVPTWSGLHTFSAGITTAKVTLSGTSGAVIDDSPATYGSISVSSLQTAYAGIQFTSAFGANGRTLMVASGSAIQGFYDTAASAWDWQFNAGALNVGTVPTTQITGVLAASHLPGLTVQAKTAAYTLVAGDHDTCISITTGGVTAPNGLAVGTIVTIYNDSASSQIITQGASLTLRQSGTTNTGSRTLVARGTCTIFYKATNEAIATGDIS